VLCFSTPGLFSIVKVLAALTFTLNINQKGGAANRFGLIFLAEAVLHKPPFGSVKIYAQISLQVLRE
jgi:hypothetical protein